MTFLPIVERELRVASRRRSTYLQRLAGALVSIGVGGWIMMATRNAMPGQLGGILFVALSIMLFVYAISAGARMTADCLSEEKREGTLGLLFLTDLKGYDIVSGKVVANALNTFYGLLSSFPVLAIPLLMGGVTSTEFWRVSLTATNLLFFSVATGILASSICREERKSLSVAFFLLLVFIGATPLFELLYSLAHQHSSWRKPVLLFTPAFPCFAAFGNKINLTAREFWISSGITHFYAWLLLALSSAIVPRSWQDKAVKLSGSRNVLQRLFDGGAEKRRTFRLKLLETNPFFWLASRDRQKQVMVWAVIFGLAVLWIWAWIRWWTDWIGLSNYVMTAIVLHTLLKYWISSEACHRFLQDRKTGALELILATPLSVSEILRGQRLALFRQFAGPTLFVLVLDCVFTFVGLNSRELDQGSEISFWVMMWIAGSVVFIFDLFAVSWVSMWLGMKAQKSNRASAAAVTRVMVIPWLVFLMSLTVWAMISALARFEWSSGVALWYWFSLSVVNNVIFIAWAKRNLRNRFREIATQRFAAKSTRALLPWNKSVPPPLHLPPVINAR